jgi:SAM-dependent methyltransferase
MDRVTHPFSERVAHYAQHRPGYPPAVLDLLVAECGLTPACRVADVGSGTGLLSRLFLEHGNVVFGVEPDPEMRRAAEEQLRRYANFVSVAASAEATSLAGHSVDLVTAGQAFHWFDAPRAHQEFKRILKSDGWVVLAWNERQQTSPFMRAYERLLRTYALNDPQRTRKKHAVDLPALFGPDVKTRSFSNPHVVDFEGLRGRLLSSSYAPLEGQPNHRPMLEALHALYEAHQVGGCVTFEYATRVYYCPV